MNCPHCNSHGLYGVKGVSIQSATTRHDGVMPEIIDGKSCAICGHWIEGETATVMLFTPQRGIPALKPEAKPMLHEDIIWKYKDSITQRRDCPQPTSWQSLAHLISPIEKIKISEKQLQRCYERMVANGA